MLVGLAAALAAAALFGAASIVQAAAVRHLPAGEELGFQLIRDLLRQPLFYSAVVLNLAGFGFHFLALRRLPLFLAQCVIAASLVVTALLAVAVFADTLSSSEWGAIAAVCLGLGLLAFGSGAQGDAGEDRLYGVVLLVAVVLLAVVGVAAGHTSGAFASIVLGVCAGLGFAVVGISVRFLPPEAVADRWALLREPATYALLVGGALAFLLYSLALQRGSVTMATAPMIAVQTVTPAVVGLAVLGDAVRDGWLAVAVGGFVLAVAGVTSLARFETVR